MISYLLDLEVSGVDRWKASPCDVLRHTCLNWWEAELQRTWEKNHQLSVGAGSPIRRDVCLLLLLQRYKDLGEIPKYHPTYSCTTAPNHPHPVIIRSSTIEAGSREIREVNIRIHLLQVQVLGHHPAKSGDHKLTLSDTDFDEHLDGSDPTDEMKNMKLTSRTPSGCYQAPRPQGPPSCGWTPQSSW